VRERPFQRLGTNLHAERTWQLSGIASRA